MYRTHNQAEYDRLMAEGRAKIQAEYDADPAIRDAQRTFERAQEHLANEQHIQRNLSNDPKWHYWTQDQRFSVIMQMDERVGQARDAVESADKALGDAHAAYSKKSYQKQLDDEAAARKAHEEELQKQYASEEKAKFREEAKERYLQAGGTEDQFNHAFPDKWAKELDRRTQVGHDTMIERMKARYSGIHI